MDNIGSQPVDKNQLYGRYQRQEDRRDRLGMKAAYKALDIPEDDMQINANKIGIGTAGMAAVALAAGLPSALLAGLLLLKQSETAPPPVAPPEVTVPDTEYDVLFYDKDGNLIEVPRHKK